ENRIKSTSNKQYDRKANAIFSMEGTYKKGGKININLSLINVIKLHSVKLNYKYDNKLIRVDKIIVDSNISNEGFKETRKNINNLNGHLDFEGEIQGSNKFTGSSGIIKIEATMLTDEKLILNKGLLNLEVFNVQDEKVTLYEIDEKINSDVGILELAKVAKYSSIW
ncbi:MAG: hypothetical protein ACRC7N_07700, partial [Clostridium sp.]